MNAGRKLDALVAEKIMGWRRCQDDGSGYWEGRSPTNILSLVLEEVPHFSTDIAAAWQVVNRMTELDWYSQVTDLTLDSNGPWWSWTFTQYTNIMQAGIRECAPTPELAICLAALKALGVIP